MALKAACKATGVSARAQVSLPAVAPRGVCVKATASAVETSPVQGAASSRRQALAVGAMTAAYLAAPQIAQAAKAPSGFVTLEDISDGYKFIYPFGWQEVSISGADVVFKDVVEPLESVSVTMVQTNKGDISEYGSLAEVSETLAKSVLTAPGTDVKITGSAERVDDKGHRYYELEFTADKPNRHQLAVVTVANSRLYTLTTGSSIRRWNKMGDKLKATVSSFSLIF
ncbi:hypothetical protein FOA52_006742 [Chlamydomonas sp. UWO 241]|nr:hypothetical protein FOA52_006742 [Chlamydomonas sp. UWO 241]